MDAKARNQITAAAKEHALYLSAISAWEIATLVRGGRLRINLATDEYIRSLFALPGLREAPVSFEIGSLAGNLPDTFGGDPADRIIFATASFLGVPLATRDKRIQRFASVHGTATCVPV